MTSKPTRLSFASLIFFMYEVLKGTIVPFVAALFGTANLTSRIWQIAIIVVFVAFMLGTAIVRYLMFTYQLLEDEIVVRYGVFVKKVNHVPYDRIQNVTTNQWFFLKPFGLVELEIETAGHSEKPEVELKAVPESLRSEIDALRQRSKQMEPDEEVEVEETFQPVPENTYQISWKDLIKFALTSPAFLTGLLVVLAAYGKVSNSISKEVYQNLANEASHLGILLIVGLVVLVLLIFYVGSVIVLIVQYYHFKLTEEDSKFEMERGLLQTKKTSIARPRIQAVLVKQPWLRSFLKIVTVQLVIVSNSKKGDSEKDIIVMPVIATNKLAEFMQQFFAEIPLEIPDFKPDKWTYYYKLRNATYFAVLGSIILVIATHWFLWLSVTLVIIWVFICYLPAYFSIKRSYVDVPRDDYLVIQNNKLLTKQLFFVPKESIQFVERRQSIWLKKRNIASLTVNVRSGNRQRKLNVDYLTEAEIDRVIKWYKESTNVA
ncbi:PH domain-containing protein [Companilactobacillus sp.]|uniref:PH domain-containing protein n=1 Tax=Companilactobacillus sp. TaxID=2767905 RepID=UPI0025C2ECF5|nr:PH domain-containing protein [Companilactobacillus sp.]MCH4009841.1 PH domain-containing protein [Companilactobacillus sp.]MCH4052483.1 PH domain-containing protein [Companilactobacillus sp.]MCH4077783.1 PH domain-containing protein [Companilactobacillus sp.]MCH4126359.1 PH domain-containing protein [Companilactobacillus sp.]MCI1312067.1 PH domain-containing protein [Companilactobacillus sp.]